MRRVALKKNVSPRSFLRTVAGLWLLLCWQGWGGLAGAAPPLPDGEVYERAKVEFREAIFFKPLEARTNDVTFTLAPLIIQEVKNPPTWGSDRFGAFYVSNGMVRVDRQRPAVYFSADSVQFYDRAHARFSYAWFYSVGPGKEDTAPPAQGVRLTLGTNGEPVLWEVLSDPSGKEVMFVSETLEAAARAEFGAPLRGRKFAIERSLEEAPNAVVARVLEDGPMPMGPIVYLSADTRGVSTVICRCMPAQAKKLLATHTYELQPFDATNSLPLRPPAGTRVAFWPGGEPTLDRLARSLRIPRSF
jgi:hypothetical protein